MLCIVSSRHGEKNIFIELWKVNATSVYGGYGGSSSRGAGGSATPSGALPSGVPPTDSGSASGIAPLDAMPSVSSPDDGAGGASAALAREEPSCGRFAGITTIYSGFYERRATHIHTLVCANWVESANGTLVSDPGHIGQFFFNDRWNDQVFVVPP